MFSNGELDDRETMDKMYKFLGVDNKSILEEKLRSRVIHSPNELFGLKESP